MIKKKGDKLFVEWKGYDNSFNSCINKKDMYKMSDYLTYYKPRSSSVKVELDLKNYATKEELKNITHIDTSGFALKTNLASLKTEVDKLDIPKLKTVPIDLADLTKEVQEDFTKKTDFNSLKTKFNQSETDNDNLETKVNNNDSTTKASINNLKTKVHKIHLTKYVLKSKYNSKIGNLELKITDVSGLLQVSSFNSKVNELDNKIKTAESKPNISNLATRSSLKTVENKIPDVNGFVKLTDYSTEVTSIKNNYATKAILDSKINDLKNQHISDEVKKVDDKVKKNITDILSFKSSLDNEKFTINDLEREASYFRGKDYYLNSWLLFRPTFSSFTRGTDSLYREKWKSKGFNDESELTAVKNTSNDTPKIVNSNEKIGIRFSDIDYFKQEKVDYIRNKIINVYIVYKLTPRIITEDGFK